jgi:peptidoglycan/LPS O-acetylase OafA/YrhL
MPAASAPAAAASTPQIKFDASALSQTDRIVGIATAVLFISLFLPWFNANFGFVTASADGLSAHGYLYVTLFISLGIVAFLALGALGLWKLPTSSAISHDQVLLIGTAVSFVLVLLGFLLKPGGSGVGWDWGAFVGLAAAVVALLPLARPVIQARRGK